MPVTTDIDPSLVLLLVDASIESYYAYDSHGPAHCNPQMVTPPIGAPAVGRAAGDEYAPALRNIAFPRWR